MMLFDTQRHICIQCGGPLAHPKHGRPRRYCDADCAAEGKRATEARLMTAERLEAMRLTSRHIRLNRRNGTASAKATPEPPRGAPRPTERAPRGTQDLACRLRGKVHT